MVGGSECSLFLKLLPQPLSFAVVIPINRLKTITVMQTTGLKSEDQIQVLAFPFCSLTCCSNPGSATLTAMVLSNELISLGLITYISKMGTNIIPTSVGHFRVKCQ